MRRRAQELAGLAYNVPQARLAKRLSVAKLLLKLWVKKWKIGQCFHEVMRLKT